MSILAFVPSEESRDAVMSGDDESISRDTFDASNVGTPAALAASRNSSRASFDLAVTEAFREITASDLHEYFWPPNSVADKYFIQEQLAVFLDVKSFKRKYPDLNRRPIVEMEERTYLLKKEVVTQMQLNMGLSALRAEDVYDLMTNDYSEKFEEFKKVVAERNKQAMAVKQLELQAVKADSKRLEEWRKKAMRSAVDYNADLNRDRSRDRKYFFDMTTMVIQQPFRKRQRPYPATFGSHPAALMPGQFQDFYKKYEKDELFRLPVNGVVHVEDYLPSKRARSPDSIVVKPEEVLQAEMEENKRIKEAEAASSTSKSKKLSSVASVGRLSAEEGRADETGENCAFCQEDIYHSDRYVQCSKCGSCGHAACLDMADEMYDVVKTYNWMCMECKPCSICSKLDEEDKMLFCDRCDRGYHTFCVGLSELPSGRWVCPKFCFGVSRQKAAKAAEAAVAAVIATPSSLKPKKSLDRTVDQVAQAVLAGMDPREMLPSSIDFSDLKSASSVSNSPRSTPEPQSSKRRNSNAVPAEVSCARCGGPAGVKTRRGGRKILFCNKCLANAEDGKKPMLDDVSKGSEESQG